MSRILSNLALAVAFNAGLIVPACAGGDWGYENDVSTLGVVTPVPAPVGFPFTTDGISAPVHVCDVKWRLRTDFSSGMVADPESTAKGDSFGIASAVVLPRSEPDRRHGRKWAWQVMSALPPKADIGLS